MLPSTLSPCITTDKVAESRDFYIKHFRAKVTFDCGWYLNLELGKETASLQFMAPQSDQPLCNPAGQMCIRDRSYSPEPIAKRTRIFPDFRDFLSYPGEFFS